MTSYERILSILVLLVGCSVEKPEDHVALPPDERPSQVSVGIPLERLTEASVATSATSSLKFVELAPELTPGFTYINGSQGRRLMVEATGGGCAWLDFDRDGECDLYFVQGGIPDENPVAGADHDRIWRHSRDHFSDVTDVANVHEIGYGQGVCSGDFDNDGFDDLFVTNVGQNSLLRNLGDGTFEEVRNWGGDESRVWSSSAAWADVDQDGDLDLYVCNYCDFDPYHPQVCTNESGLQIQCAPNQVAPVADELFLNVGDGQFMSVAQQWQLSGSGNRALGVVVANFMGDSVPEIYVANDATANFLFRRDSPGKYEEIASATGCALDANGLGQASMGIATGDYNRDGLLDIYLTHFEGEWNTLYQNLGESGFRDVTADVQAVQMTIPGVGFGTIMQDFDQNGFDDLFIANGHIDDRGRKQVLEMPPQLLTYDGSVWRDVGLDAGEYFNSRYVGRGCSEADFDNDGDFDIAVVHQNRPAQILVNVSSRGHWLAIDLVGKTSNRRGIGSSVLVHQGAANFTQQLVAGGSYCSSRQPRLIFGLGESALPCRVEVQWSDGTRQTLTDVTVDQKLVIVEEDGNG